MRGWFLGVFGSLPVAIAIATAMMIVFVVLPSPVAVLVAAPVVFPLLRRSTDPPGQKFGWSVPEDWSLEVSVDKGV